MLRSVQVRLPRAPVPDVGEQTVRDDAPFEAHWQKGQQNDEEIWAGV